MQDFSSSSTDEPDGGVANPAISGAEAINEAGRRLWYRLIGLALVGIVSLGILVAQLVGAQDGILSARAERDRAVGELGVAKGQLKALAGELATAKLNRAEQIIATDKDSRRIEGEVAALKTQRAALAAQIDELVRHQQEAERRLATATQRRTEVEGQLAALRAELATAQTGKRNKPHRTPKPAGTP